MKDALMERISDESDISLSGYLCEDIWKIFKELLNTYDTRTVGSVGLETNNILREFISRWNITGHEEAYSYYNNLPIEGKLQFDTALNKELWACIETLKNQNLAGMLMDTWWKLMEIHNIYLRLTPTDCATNLPAYGLLKEYNPEWTVLFGDYFIPRLRFVWRFLQVELLESNPSYLDAIEDMV